MDVVDAGGSGGKMMVGKGRRELLFREVELMKFVRENEQVRMTFED